MGWVLPTGHNDPDNKWSNETLAYDNDTGTSASVSVVKKVWTSVLQFIIDAIECDKIRFYAPYAANNQSQIELQVYYDGSWHIIYTGAYNNDAWTEKPLEATKVVTAAQVKFYNNANSTLTFYIREFQFNEVESGLINGYFMQNGAREEKFGYFMNLVEIFGYFMNPKI